MAGLLALDMAVVQDRVRIHYPLGTIYCWNFPFLIFLVAVGFEIEGSRTMDKAEPSTQWDGMKSLLEHSIS